MKRSLKILKLIYAVMPFLFYIIPPGTCSFLLLQSCKPFSFLFSLQHNPKVETVIENGSALPETKTIPTENGNLFDTQDKDVVMEGLSSVDLYDQWVAPPVSGPRPKARYEVFVCLCFKI